MVSTQQLYKIIVLLLLTIILVYPTLAAFYPVPSTGNSNYPTSTGSSSSYSSSSGSYSFFSLNSVFEPFRGLNLGNFYLQYYQFLDAIVYLMLFLGLAKMVFSKIYKDKDTKQDFSKPITVGVGIALTFAMIMFEMNNNFNLAQLAPIAVIIFILVLAIVLYNLLNSVFEDKILAFCITYLIMFGVLASIFAPLYAWIAQNIPILSALLNITLLIAFIVLLIRVFGLFKGDNKPGTENPPPPPPGPRARLSVTIAAAPNTGNAPLNTTFTASPSGGSGTYNAFRWNFGDRNRLNSGGTVNHTYVAPGNYQASVEVLDSDGGSASSGTTTIQVAPGGAGGGPAVPDTITITLPPTGNPNYNVGDIINIEFNVQGTYITNNPFDYQVVILGNPFAGRINNIRAAVVRHPINLVAGNNPTVIGNNVIQVVAYRRGTNQIIATSAQQPFTVLANPVGLINNELAQLINLIDQYERIYRGPIPNNLILSCARLLIARAYVFPNAPAPLYFNEVSNAQQNLIGVERQIIATMQAIINHPDYPRLNNAQRNLVIAQINRSIQLTIGVDAFIQNVIANYNNGVPTIPLAGP